MSDKKPREFWVEYRYGEFSDIHFDEYTADRNHKANWDFDNPNLEKNGELVHVREVLGPSPSQDEQAKASTKQLIEDLGKHEIGKEPFFVKNQTYSTEYSTPGEPVVIEGYSTSQDEFDEKAAAAEVDLWVNKLFPMSFHDTERADAAFIGLQMAHWQFNQMKRKNTEGG